MVRLGTTTRQALPLTSRRITAIPRRITGLYRLSVISKKPFEVDIGGRVIDNARTLDVFHETPMFIDTMQNAAALDFFAHGDIVRMVRIHPVGRGLSLGFRITAYEELPERNELDRTIKLACIEAPLEYEGFLKHSVHGLLDSVSPHPDENDGSGSGTDAIAGAIALGLTLGIGAILIAPLAVPLLLGVTGLSPAIFAVAPVVACDPSRTYINGKLYKNLKELRVSAASGRVVGYAHP
jgi:hypothetical protein